MGWPKVTLDETNRSKIANISSILNWVCIIPSLIVLSVGVYIQTSLQSKFNVIEDYSGKALPVFLILFGFISAVSNILVGKVCTANQSPERRVDWGKYLLPSVISGLIIFICVFISGILCFVYVSHLRESFYQGFVKAMYQYKDDVAVKEEIDLMQIEFECCGSEAFTDWFKIPWINEDYVPESKTSDLPYLNDDVPFSCCSPESPRPCIHHQVMDNDLHYNYDFRSGLTIYPIGCRDKLTEYYGQGMLTNVGAIVISISIFQIIIVILTRFLQTSIQTLLDAGDDPDSPAEGYLLPWGKTAIKAVKEFKEEIKKYHKRDRDEEGEQEGEPLMSERDYNSENDNDTFDSDFDSIGEDDEESDEFEATNDTLPDDAPHPPLKDLIGYDHRSQQLIEARSLHDYQSFTDGRRMSHMRSVDPHNNNRDEEKPIRIGSMHGNSTLLLANPSQREFSMNGAAHRMSVDPYMDNRSEEVLTNPSQREFSMNGVASSYTAPSEYLPPSYAENNEQSMASLHRSNRHLNGGVASSDDLYSYPARLASNSAVPSQMSIREARRYVNGDVIYTLEPTAQMDLDARLSQDAFVRQHQPTMSNMDFSRRPSVQITNAHTLNYPTTAPPPPPIPQELGYNELSFSPQTISMRELTTRTSAQGFDNSATVYSNPAPPAPLIPQEMMQNVSMVSSQSPGVGSHVGLASRDFPDLSRHSLTNTSIFPPELPPPPPIPPEVGQYASPLSVQKPDTQSTNIQGPISHTLPHTSDNSLGKNSVSSFKVPPAPPIPSEVKHYVTTFSFQAPNAQNNVQLPHTPPRTSGQPLGKTSDITPETVGVSGREIHRLIPVCGSVSPIPPAPPIPHSL
ncbi:hypothetical protein ScPMuIL_014076 [Solemya velum]